MVNGNPARSERAGIRIDRLVAAIGIAALALSITIGIRTGADRISGANLTTLAGLRLLAPDDRLVTFEDFELGAPGWAGLSSDRSNPNFGGILGRFGGTEGAEQVMRTYAVPSPSAYAVVSFDLHAIDDWALEDVIVFANGVEVLCQSFSTRPDLAGQQRSVIAELPWIRADLSAGERSGAERGFGDGSEATADQTVSVRLLLARPEGQLRLGFGSTLPDAGTERASWAIDNLQIVTSLREPQQ